MLLLFLLIKSFSSSSFRCLAWEMVILLYIVLLESRNLFNARSLIFEKHGVKFVAGTTSLVGKSLFWSFFLWSLIRSFGVGIALEFRLSWMKFDLSDDSWGASFFARSDACLKMCITFCLGVSLAFFIR